MRVRISRAYGSRSWNANTRAAILAGADQIQGTLLGTGERCGNVNLTTVVGSMQLRVKLNL